MPGRRISPLSFEQMLNYPLLGIKIGQCKAAILCMWLEMDLLNGLESEAYVFGSQSKELRLEEDAAERTARLQEVSHVGR